jgi:outer membrane protein assembly factor BamD (BamD/ComL family)
MDASSVHYLLRVAPCSLAWSLAAVCALIVTGSGCATGKSSPGTSVLGKEDSNKNGSFFYNPFAKKPPRTIIDPDAGLDEYDAAVAKFEKKEYEAAAKDFKGLIKKYYDYPVEEDAMYMLGETRYAEKKYAWAQDAYDGLLKKYPSTRHLEKSTRRLFAIGAIWLNGDGSEKTEELLQVSATDVTDPQAVQRKELTQSWPLVPNLFDPSRPLFDTSGNALKALKSVWLHDPMGPLADDAVMLTAIYYIRKGSYRDADHWLHVLRTEYPKSEHTQTAFVVGSHIKQVNYQGPRYDGRDLIEADDLIHSTLNLFPNVEDKEGLKAELVKIREQGAERYWARALYYRGRRKPAAEAIYCETIIKEFSDSEFSNLARGRLKELGPTHWSGMLDEYPDTQEPAAKSKSLFGKPSAPAPNGKPPIGDRPRGTLPGVKPRQAKESATPPQSNGTGEPQFPGSTNRPLRPPVRKADPVLERLPDAEPIDKNPPKSDGEAPPARRGVDEPDFADEKPDAEIEQVDGDDVGRVRL